jgi:hypothetical protein
LGAQTADPDIRQIVIRFGASGYIARDAVIAETETFSSRVFGMGVRHRSDRQTIL